MCNLGTIGRCLLEIMTSDYFIGIASLLILLMLIKLRSRERVLIITSSKLGCTRTSEHALKTVIYGLCNEIDVIMRSRVTLSIKRGKLNVRLKLKLGQYSNLFDLSTELQNRLRDIFVNDLGLNNIGKIDIFISDFSAEKNASCDRFLSEYSCEKKCEQEQNVQ